MEPSPNIGGEFKTLSVVGDSSSFGTSCRCFVDLLNVLNHSLNPLKHLCFFVDVLLLLLFSTSTSTTQSGTSAAWDAWGGGGGGSVVESTSPWEEEEESAAATAVLLGSSTTSVYGIGKEDTNMWWVNETFKIKMSINKLTGLSKWWEIPLPQHSKRGFSTKLLVFFKSFTLLSLLGFILLLLLWVVFEMCTHWSDSLRTTPTIVPRGNDMAAILVFWWH